jgi:hypothetical protein
LVELRINYQYQIERFKQEGEGSHTPPAAQVPTSYESPARNIGSPMKMAALTMLTADEDSCTAVLVYPWLGSPPPHRATSMISPP